MKWLIIILAALLLGIITWRLCYSPAAVSAVPNLPIQWWDQVYGLEDDEVIRLVVPPFSPQRATAIGSLVGQATYEVAASGKISAIAWTSKTGDIRSALAHCVEIPNSELRVTARAANVVVDGDWVVREQAPHHRRMEALAKIFGVATGGRIEVTANWVAVYCVVVKGSWDRAGKTTDATQPLRFTATIPKGSPPVAQGAPKDFIRVLEESCRCRFFDETVAPSKMIMWWDDVPGGAWDGNQRRAIFRTLESQTSLQFIETRRPVAMWNVAERPSATQPVNKK